MVLKKEVLCAIAFVLAFSSFGSLLSFNFYGYTKELPAKNRIKVSFDGEAYYIGVVEVRENNVTINVSSDPIQVVLGIGDDARFDVTNDSYYDIYLKVNSINNNKVNLSVRKIHELVPEGAGKVQTSGEVVGGSEEKKEHVPELAEESAREFSWFVWLGAIGGLIFFVVAGVGAKWLVRRLKKNPKIFKSRK